jgi:hypothetical protein
MLNCTFKESCLLVPTRVISFSLSCRHLSSCCYTVAITLLSLLVRIHSHTPLESAQIHSHTASISPTFAGRQCPHTSPESYIRRSQPVYSSHIRRSLLSYIRRSLPTYISRVIRSQSYCFHISTSADRCPYAHQTFHTFTVLLSAGRRLHTPPMVYMRSNTAVTQFSDLNSISAIAIPRFQSGNQSSCPSNLSGTSTVSPIVTQSKATLDNPRHQPPAKIPAKMIVSHRAQQ